MLTRLYVEALLADPDAADQVRELWIVGVIPTDLAAWAWFILALRTFGEWRLSNGYASFFD